MHSVKHYVKMELYNSEIKTERAFFIVKEFSNVVPIIVQPFTIALTSTVKALKFPSVCC